MVKQRGNGSAAPAVEHKSLSLPAHAFVALVFMGLAFSFVSSTVMMIREFGPELGLDIAISHSHLFIFFPLLGLLALAAFYLPAVIFTDHYFRNLKWHGWLRFGVGFLVVALFSYVQASSLNSGALRALWEISPKALEADRAAPVTSHTCTDVAHLEAVKEARDRGDPPPQGRPTKPCARKPIVDVLQKLRAEAQHRSSLSVFSRNCRPDVLLEPPATFAAERYCFPAGQKLNAADCCRIQADFRENVRRLYVGSETRSATATTEAVLLYAKVFFITVLLVIGIMLIFWRKALKRYYGSYRSGMERGIMIGAFSMLIWVFMDYGYQQTTDVLFGRMYDGIAPRLSLFFVPWAVLLLLYFMERLGEDLERVAQIATIVGTGFTLLRYQEINDWTARLLGVGAAPWHFYLLAAVALAGLLALIVGWLRPDWLESKRHRAEPTPPAPPAQPLT